MLAMATALLSHRAAFDAKYKPAKGELAWRKICIIELP
jgi:hypothetical protein